MLYQDLIQHKIDNLRNQKSQLVITREQEEEINKKVEAYRKELIQQLTNDINKMKIVIDSKIEVLEELQLEQLEDEDDNLE